jgi:hypothetical protein
MGFYSFYPPSGGSNASIGTNGAPAPTSSTEVAGIDPSGNLHPLQTGPAGALIVVPEAGSVQHVIVDSSALPAGASTSALQTSGNSSLTSIDGKTPVLGQALAAGSVPVVLTAAQQAALTPLSTVTVVQPTGSNLHTVVDSGTISVSNFPATQPVSGTVTANQGTGGASAWKVDGSAVTQPISAATLPLPAGAATGANQTSANTSLSSIDSKTPALGQALAASSVPVVLPAAQIATLTPLSTVTVTQATGANLHTVIDSGTVTANQGAANATPWNSNTAQINGAAPLMGNGVTGVGSLRVTLASDTSSNTNPFLVKQTTSGTSTVTAVSSTPSSVSLLASNAARRGASVTNDSTATLYLILGTTASTVSYTVPLVGGAYYELPFQYTGAVAGIWSGTGGGGGARITEVV